MEVKQITRKTVSGYQAAKVFLSTQKANLIGTDIATNNRRRKRAVKNEAARHIGKLAEAEGMFVNQLFDPAFERSSSTYEFLYQHYHGEYKRLLKNVSFKYTKANDFLFANFYKPEEAITTEVALSLWRILKTILSYAAKCVLFAIAVSGIATASVFLILKMIKFLQDVSL